MTLCPIAIAVGCKKCPAFGICPLKGVIGDQGKADDAPAKAASQWRAAFFLRTQAPLYRQRNAASLWFFRMRGCFRI